ncbi:MAG: TIGR02646 family protein [Clostridia bacterium]|nr:TIGR02646 family protein [Clostridia bacterium]
MTKFEKPDAPQVLSDNQAIWTKALLDAVALYGSYKKIPEAEKKSLLSHYKHKDIQELLFACNHHKCAFCECKPGETSNIEVEHFEPKSIYPDLAFEWDNLLPSCRKCNEAKSDHDTRTSPIINPAKEDPEMLLTYDSLRIVPLQGSGQEKKADNTITVCNLNCNRLYNARAELLISVTEYMDELKNKFEWIEEADTQQKRRVRITKLSNSIEIIDSMLRTDQPFSAYCKWLVTTFPEYQEAKKIIASR